MTPPRSQHSASVSPRSKRDGTVSFDVRYRLEGKSKRLTFTSQKSAEKWASVVRNIGPLEALKFLRLDIREGSPTVSEHAAVYIANKSGIEGLTTDHYKMYMRLHIAPVMGDLPIDAISPAMIAGWINAQAEDDVAPKTIKNRHGFLSAMFQSAVDADPQLITRNPCAKSNLPDSLGAEMVFLTADEFFQLLDFVPAQFQPLVSTLANTGLRWGEATALRPADIDLDRLTLRVARAWKSSKAKGWYVGPPKTPKSRRTIPIPQDLADMLRPLMESGNEYLFTNTRGSAIRQSNFWTRVWDPARRLSNGLPPFETAKLDKTQPFKAMTGHTWDREPAAVPVGKIPRIHDLRHSHASWLLEAGVGIDVVQQRLGHEKVTTTIDTYGHIGNHRSVAAATSIGRILTRQVGSPRVLRIAEHIPAIEA